MITEGAVKKRGVFLQLFFGGVAEWSAPRSWGAKPLVGGTPTSPRGIVGRSTGG